MPQVVCYETELFAIDTMSHCASDNRYEYNYTHIRGVQASIKYGSPMLPSLERQVVLSYLVLDCQVLK
jgi:hypothetical protein